MLLDEVEDLDLKIATKKGETDDSAGDTDFGQYVALLQKARKHRQEASQYHQQALEMQEYITHLVATGEGPLAENAPSRVNKHCNKELKSRQEKILIIVNNNNNNNNNNNSQ